MHTFVSYPLVATCGHPKEKDWNEFGRKEFQAISKKLVESVVYLAINQNKLHKNPAKKRILQFIIIPSTYLMLFALDLKAFHLSAPICPMKLASKAPHLWWDGSNSQTVAGCHSLPSQAKLHLYFFPISNLSVWSFASACVTWTTKNGDRLKWRWINGSIAIAQCLFFQAREPAPISWCSQLIDVFYQFFYSLYSTQVFVTILHEG